MGEENGCHAAGRGGHEGGQGRAIGCGHPAGVLDPFGARCPGVVVTRRGGILDPALMAWIPPG